ncbi:MAG: hypothetical protein KGP14_07610 [Betaproteobacteria bacterium]|nr:hypothetical protein [Betaproteobacteria bacterium]
MTGKQLKEWANAQHDDALIEVRENYSWSEDFAVRATTQNLLHTNDLKPRNELVES